MPGVFDSVPWPDPFLNFVIPLDFVYLDFLNVVDHCTLFAPFFDTFALHMMAPWFLLTGVFAAFAVARCCCRRTDGRRSKHTEKLYQVLILGVLMMCECFVFMHVCM